MSDQEATASAGQAEASATPTPESKSSVTVLNGPKSAGMASKIETVLSESMDTIEVTEKGNSKNDYPTTVVSAVNPEAAPRASEIAKQLKATVESLPDGENTPKTDIVVFVGDDQV